MKLATEVHKLINRLRSLEARAAGLRAATSPASDNGHELRQIEREHPALLLEYAKGIIKDALERGPALVASEDFPPDPFVNGSDPLGSAAFRVEVRLLFQLRAWSDDEAAGRPLPSLGELPNLAAEVIELAAAGPFVNRV